MNPPFPTKRASAAQLEMARRLLALEEAAGADERATPLPARVFDKFVAHLSALIGDAGVALLFARSAKLVEGELGPYGGSILEGSTKLRERLAAGDPPVPLEAAAALFGTFYALLTNFIGERLTTQVLRRAWPTFDEAAPAEKDS